MMTGGGADRTAAAEKSGGTDIVAIAMDRRLWRGGGPLLVAWLVLANAIIGRAERGLQAERRANLLVAHSKTSAEDQPRYDWSVGENLGHYWQFIPDARRQPLIVLSGMSQMYAINDPQPGDEIIVEHLDDALAPTGVRAFGLAAPNLDNEEALLYLLSTAIDAKTKPAAFVYGVCFDKFRNVDLRPGLTRFLRETPGLREAWLGVCDARSEKYPMACAKIRAVAGPLQTSDGAPEDDLEHRLRAELGGVVPMIGSSTDLNAYAQIAFYDIRNWLFRIRSSSKRPLLESAYRLNQQLLELMADVAKEQGVTLMLYIIPLNSLADNPYVPEQYESFKHWLGGFAAARRIPFENLEAAVKQENWGLLNGEPDYKHFRERGHEETAAALLRGFDAGLQAVRLQTSGAAGAP